MRIGFLFNHDQLHQVAHSLPIALALKRLHPEVDVVIAATNDRLEAEIRRLAVRIGAPVPAVRRLGLGSAIGRGLARLLDPLLPAGKIAAYRDNLDFFRSLDALVVAEKTSTILKRRYGLDRLCLIHSRHGAGDRAIGFDKASAAFDHVLASGPKIRDRLIREAGVDPARISVTGYPKFDLLADRPRLLPMQANGRPTVLYNPHPSPHLSSWFRHGRAVLDYFRASDRYNLIFAPHVMLFHRRFVMTIDKLRIDRPGRIEPEYRDAPNIHVDLGSPAATDMTYTSAADIYLGDVSSQIYEYLHRPRPCLFLNSHRASWASDPNYAHWRSGPVIEDIAELGAGLDRAIAGHADYLPEQRRLFDASFDLTGGPSGERAAEAVLAATIAFGDG